MSDLIQAIDAIFKLLPWAKTLTGQKRREYFKTLVEPLFASLEKAHDYYITLILDTREQIVNLHSNEFAMRRNEEPSAQYRRKLKKIKEQFLERRMRDERLRDVVRQDARQFLSAISWKEERRFLVLVAYYFLGSGGIAPDDRSVDTAIERIISRGGDSYWDTPSIRLYNQIRAETDYEILINLLDEARLSLLQRFMNARFRFKAVQQHLVLKK